MRLTGEYVTDYSNASLVGVAFDIVNRRWRMDMVETIGLDPEKFARLAPCHKVIGTVTARAAAECGLAAGTPVVAGTVDCNAAWLGNGCTRPGDASFVMGTAGAMGVVHDQPRFTRNLTTIVHTADSERLYTTLAGTSCCGGLLRYLRDCFADEAQPDAYRQFDSEAARVPAGSDGLIVLPYLAGERTPLWNPIARGMVFGLSLSHHRGHWVRAMMEGGIYAVYHCLKLMRESELPIPKSMLVSEGGATSALWRQIASDVMDVELSYMRDAKGAPTGDAINAGVGVGLFKDYDVARNLISIDQIHVPDPAAHATYERHFALYRKLSEDNKENYALLHALGND
jgi:sugar (pentulose or hexulose) kinase